MKKSVHLVLLVSVLTLLIPFHTWAADPCQTVLPPGLWEGTMHADLVVIEQQSGIVIRDMRIHDTGAISLTIGCNVTSGDLVFQSSRTVKMPIINFEIACVYDVHFTQPSANVVAGGNGQPRIDVRWATMSLRPRGLVKIRAILPPPSSSTPPARP